MKKKKYNHSLRELIYVVILIIIISILYFYIGYSYGLNNSEDSNDGSYYEYLNTLENVEPKINVNDLNKEDRKSAFDVVGMINPKYLQGTKEIYFDYDLMDDYIMLGNSYLENTELHGFHSQRSDGNKIYIKFDNYWDMKEALCHESLHSWIINTPTSHELINDMVKKGVCYG